MPSFARYRLSLPGVGDRVTVNTPSREDQVGTVVRVWPSTMMYFVKIDGSSSEENGPFSRLEVQKISTK